MATKRKRVPAQARAVRTRAALCEAAAREFSARGYAAATAKSIAAEAGVATGSFYEYFGDKDELLRELGALRLQSIAARSLDLMAADSAADSVGHGGAATPDEIRERMRTMVELVVDYHREDPGLHAVLTERRHHDEKLDEMTTAAERTVVERIAGLLRGWGFVGDRLATAFVAFGMVEGSVHAHVLGHSMVSDKRFIAALVDALVAVVSAPQPAITTRGKHQPTLHTPLRGD